MDGFHDREDTSSIELDSNDSCFEPEVETIYLCAVKRENDGSPSMA